MRFAKMMVLGMFVALPAFSQLPFVPWTYQMGWMYVPIGIETFYGGQGLQYTDRDATAFRAKFDLWGYYFYWTGLMSWGWMNIPIKELWTNPAPEQTEHRIKFFSGHIYTNPPGSNPDPRLRMFLDGTSTDVDVRVLDPNYFGKNQYLFLSGCKALRKPDPNYYYSMFATTALHAVYGHSANNFEYAWQENGEITGGSWDVWNHMWYGFFTHSTLADAYFEGNRAVFHERLGRGIMPAVVYRYG